MTAETPALEQEPDWEDRVCFSRFFHQMARTVTIRGTKYCADCRPNPDPELDLEPGPTEPDPTPEPGPTDPEPTE